MTDEGDWHQADDEAEGGLSFLPGLHGTIGVVLFCALLFAEEAGVPLPFAPGELVLLAAGLIGARVKAPLLAGYVLLPLAFGLERCWKALFWLTR